MPTLAFRTQDQATLFTAELAGQISDGHWENSTPRDHWKPWCRAEVIVDPENVGRDFYAQRDTYNFANKGLLEVVGQRMINYVRIARAFGPEHVGVFKYLYDLDGAFQGVPAYDGEHWDGVRARITEALAGLVPEAVPARLAEHAAYDLKALRADLKEMKAAIRQQRRAVAA